MAGKTQETERLSELFRQHDHDKLPTFVAEFVHVSTRAIGSWIGGNASPKGEKLVRLRVLLDLLDYRVKAFGELAEPVKGLCRLIAFDLITVDEARELLHYVDEKSLYDVIIRGNGLLTRRQHPLLRQVERSESTLAQETERFHQKFKEQFGATASDSAADSQGGDTSGSVPDTPSDAPGEPAPSILSQEADGVANDMTRAIRLVSYISGAIQRQDDPIRVRRQVLDSIGGSERLENVIDGLVEILDTN